METGRNEALEQAVLAAAKEVNGRNTLSCPAAFQIAREMGLKPAAVGRVCNDLNVKMTGCQLGCF